MYEASQRADRPEHAIRYQTELGKIRVRFDKRFNRVMYLASDVTAIDWDGVKRGRPRKKGSGK